MSSLLDPSDPSHKDLQSGLAYYQQILEKRLQRKGERPRDYQSRAQCIYLLNKIAFECMVHDTHSDYFVVLMAMENPYPPSVAAMGELKKLMIEDLQIETNHRGSYILLRFAYTASRLTDVTNVAEDEAGSPILFILIMQEREAVRRADTILKENGVIILKEPFLTSVKEGGYCIRVDHPTDIVWLAEDDARIPEKWRVKAAKMPKSAEHWKMKGNEMFGEASYYEAIDMYSKALRSNPSSEEKDMLHRNRALAFLRIEAYDAAMDEISCLAKVDDKGLHRWALALYGLGRFDEALKVLQRLVSTYPDSAIGKQELARCRLRLAEQESGIYDFQALYKAAKRRPPRLDIATYRGPVEVRASAGRGRGLYTTKPVQAGDLLLCEKAFAYSYAMSQEDIAKQSSMDLETRRREVCYLFHVPMEKITVGTHPHIINKISTQLILNPSLKPAFEDLYHGDYQSNTTPPSDGSTVVDTFLVARTVYFNAFRSPLTSRHKTRNPEEYSDPSLCTSGLWILASYINHSCEPNCRRAFIGDVQIVRAARDMPADTEITLSYIETDDPAKMNQRLFDGWGFDCTCAMCVDDRETPAAVKNRRQRLFDKFSATTDVKKRKSIITLLDKTYRHPPVVVPRIRMYPVHLLMALDVVNPRRRDAGETIGRILAAFESLGFIIEGAVLVPGERIVVRRWGFAHDMVTIGWLELCSIYQALGEDELAEQAKELARITTVLLFGEDTTFNWARLAS
ncbi:uncharacterized protein L3040_001187 [Drepanopeziza brunnea f. sp. 'multigermtubi']|uniref:TPR domain protein n=1 Tax=Marssonina brunnea f. sp. multigermtubi (strain MB_m1) TaxID=1072389 RepID=K1WH39_MARBU|nr:TPR domain protein [Drepanopeziza brunnea f. sp. 'multigermtubi' MB_m1]EKD16905.1 TPR domain protein [Drepanopeziza brunnea f. sp. 'multigermtubi' MB_m1]KAJ5054925.1 hypothetical protein L3040_001187 [Drepanopeziza brunnea f. sp. 'multigermtubi']